MPRLRKAPGDEVADLRGDDEPPGDVPDDGGAKESVPQARDDDVVEDDVDGDLRGMVKEDPESANRKYNVLIPWDRKA